MWVLWWLGALVGTSLLLSLIDRPPAWSTARTTEALRPIKAPALL
jgi:hypothetical protein